MLHYYFYPHWHKNIEFPYNTLQERKSFTFIWNPKGFEIFALTWIISLIKEKRIHESYKLQLRVLSMNINHCLYSQNQVVKKNMKKASTQSYLVSFLDFSQLNLFTCFCQTRTFILKYLLIYIYSRIFFLLKKSTNNTQIWKGCW